MRHGYRRDIEAVTPLAKKLASQISPSEADEDDLVQVGLIALAQAWEKTPDPDHPWAFARMVMSRHMHKYANAIRKKTDPLVPINNTEAERQQEDGGPAGVSQERLTQEQVQDPEGIPGARASRIMDSLFIEAYLDGVERELGIRERWVAENFLETGPVLARYVTQDAREKERAMAENPDLNLRNYRGTLSPSQRHLRRAVGLGPKDWRDLLARLRAWTAAWLKAQGEDLVAHDAEHGAYIRSFLAGVLPFLF